MFQTFPERILVVDDEANVSLILQRYLTNEHHACVPARSAYDALDMLARDTYSLLITDIMMPGMSGLELLRHVHDRNPEIAVIMITGVMDLSAAMDSLRMGASDFITKPIDLPAMRRAVDRALERRRLLLENRYYQQELEKLIRERTCELNGALREIEQSYRITLEALATALDAREHETQAHSQRVREYTSALARQMGLQSEDLIQVGRGALLHDVGKIGVPDSILLKPGKLTPDEWEEMKKHPRIGYDILRSIRFLAPAAEIVLTHQERWDGKGYPSRLGETDIPLGARIFSVVDTLDAITSDRPYRKAMSFEAARAEIRRCSGTQFDPHVVDAFLSIPDSSWMEIHDQVNRAHQAQDCYDVICQA